MKLLLMTLLAACGAGFRAQPTTLPTDDDATSFAHASQAGDVAAVRKMLGDRVSLGGLWFADPQCGREFPAMGTIEGARLDTLAKCLTGLHLATSSRKDPLPDVAILTYEPGIEIEARFLETDTGPRLSWIGYVGRNSPADALPTISPDALEKLRTDGKREPDVTGLDAEIAGAQPHYSHAWVKLCIDTTGAVTGVHLREASSGRAARTFTAAIADWKFKPFEAGGHALPVCSLVVLGKPLAETLKDEAIPFPFDESSRVLIVPSHELHRVHGVTQLSPDDNVKRAIVAAHLTRVIGLVKVCLDPAGKVSSVLVVRSTGFPSYDQELVNGISGWQYQPYLDEGTAVPVCASVKFVYTQSLGLR